jgi:hypothetical protein
MSRAGLATSRRISQEYAHRPQVEAHKKVNNMRSVHFAMQNRGNLPDLFDQLGELLRQD